MEDLWLSFFIIRAKGMAFMFCWVLFLVIQFNFAMVLNINVSQSASQSTHTYIDYISFDPFLFLFSFLSRIISILHSHGKYLFVQMFLFICSICWTLVAFFCSLLHNLLWSNLPYLFFLSAGW